MEIKPIAKIYTDFDEKFGIPRQSGRAESRMGKIVFEQEYNNHDAVRGIEEFSHIWLIFGFSEAKRERDVLTVRPPRLGGNERVGVFASRSPFRPNSLGLSCVKLEEIGKNEKDGLFLIVSGVDILCGTPIYDIKPYIPYADSRPDAKGSFAEKNKDYLLEVEFDDELLALIPKEKQMALIECLKDDPRPAYHDDGRKYAMSFAGFDVSFIVEGKRLCVIGVCKRKNTQ